ncbi:MAG: hypothetical protein QW745_07020 [Thermoplasmata archaeon]
MENKKQKEEKQETTNNTEIQKDIKIEGAEIIEQKPLLVLHENDFEHDSYKEIYPRDIFNLKVGESIGILEGSEYLYKESERITKIFENSKGILLLHESFTQDEKNFTKKVKRKLIWII